MHDFLAMLGALRRNTLRDEQLASLSCIYILL